MAFFPTYFGYFVSHKEGGRALEDHLQIREDQGLREVLGLKRIPSSDAIGDWVRRSGHNGCLKELESVNHQVQTLRWKLFGTSGKVICHGRSIYLKVSRLLGRLFARIRRRSWEYAQGWT